jgi:hypothetical protein
MNIFFYKILKVFLKDNCSPKSIGSGDPSDMHLRYRKDVRATGSTGVRATYAPVKAC